jgi:hypothetical protein
LNHRRPSHDELTPEDLFRPEPPQAQGTAGNTIPGEVVRSNDMPWNASAEPEYFGDAPAAYAPAPQQSYGQQAAYLPQSYQPQAEEASTQYMPPFQAEQQTQQYQQQPPPPPQQQQQQQPYGGGYQQQGYGYQAPPPPQDPGSYPQQPGPGRRFSPKAIAIAVVVACAVIGVAVGAAVSGGKTTGAAGTTGSSASTSASASPAGPGADQAQAKALSDLLNSAANSRESVVSAVADIERCQNLDGAAQDLTAASGMRGQLITQLGTLQTGSLSHGAELVTALKQGWTASQNADAHYADWAKASKGSCAHKHQPKNGDDKQAGDRASSTATVAKQKASQLWDAIASSTGLPARASTQL